MISCLIEVHCPLSRNSAWCGAALGAVDAPRLDMSDMVMRGKIVDSPEGPMYIDHSADYEVMNREHDEENEEDFHETIDKARRGAGEQTSRF